MDHPDNEPLDQLAIMRAQLDQLAALMPEIARTARAWFNAFRAEGFDDKQALYLATAQLLQNPGTPSA